MGIYQLDSKEEIIKALTLILEEAKKDSYTIEDIAFDVNELTKAI